jgi:hypothetical protein
VNPSGPFFRLVLVKIAGTCYPAKCSLDQPQGSQVWWFVPQFPAFGPKDGDMAKRNYQFEKRQKELAKKKKQEDKRLRKQERKESEALQETEGIPAESPEENEEADT